MAEQRILHFVGDIDGSAAHETVSFRLDGREYEIDLSEGHAATLRDRLGPFISGARRVSVGGARGSGRVGRSSGRTAGSRQGAVEIRQWARANGFELSDRGRIPATVLSAYRDRHDTVKPVTPTVGKPASRVAAVTTGDPGQGSDADVVAWHEAKGYKVPATGKVNGLMRHRYRTAHRAGR